MLRITRHALLALVAIAAPIAGPSQSPQPKLRKIAMIPGVEVVAPLRMPNGRIIVFGDLDRGKDPKIVAYDLVSKRSTVITRHFNFAFDISSRGDRIAFSYYNRQVKDSSFNDIWSIPIDSGTGAPTGTAQRVTCGASPSFSPDGKLLAYIPCGVAGVGIVTATGGPERVLSTHARKDGASGTSWSADGKWIFYWADGRERAIERVPAAGGPSEKVLSFPNGTGIGPFGAISGQIAFYWPDRRAHSDGRMGYVTASGVRGEFKIPLTNVSGYTPTTMATQSLIVDFSGTTSVRILKLTDGTIRDLIPGLMQSRHAVWSPDGRRLALQTGTGAGEHFEITVVNADGSQSRRYPVNVTGRNMVFSPDGQKLAYYSRTYATELSVLDLATGKTRAVSSAPTDNYNSPDRIPHYIWRPDGKSILLIKNSPTPFGQPRGVFEANLDGTERKLWDIDAEYSNPNYVQSPFISDRLLLFRGNRETYVIPISGGPRQKLPWVPPGNPYLGASRDGRWLLWLNGDGYNSLELMSTSGESVRTLRLPFEASGEGYFSRSLFDPAGLHVILVGRVQGNNASRIFRVPLDGTAPRVLGTLPDESTIGNPQLSPDRSTVAYTQFGTPTSSIYELDVSPILQGLGIR